MGYTFKPKNPMNTDLVKLRRQIFLESLETAPRDVQEKLDSLIDALARLMVQERVVRDPAMARERAELFFAQVIMKEAPARCPVMDVTPAGRKVMVYL